MTRRTAVGGITWLALMASATAVLVWARTDIEQSHAALILLLLVLGGSAAGGRWIGFSLAGLGFGLLDYFFQPPYDRLSVDKPLDWVVLVAFLTTAFVTTELLARTRQEKSLAEARANEVGALATLGAETLRHGDADEALDAITRLVREAIGASSCVVIARDEDGGIDSAGDALLSSRERVAAREAIERGHAVSMDTEGSWTVHGEELLARDDPAIRNAVLVIPLRAEGRTLGILVVRAEPLPRLDPPRRRLLAALTHYATAAVERRRLKIDAANSEALRETQRAKDVFFAGVSHDLRTPITTIKLIGQEISSSGVPAAQGIVEQADRLTRMVADLLEISRLRAGSYSLNLELNTLEDLLGAAVRQMQGSLDGRRIDLHVDLDAPALVGQFDFVHTLRTVCNLLENALRHSPPSAAVELRAGHEGKWLSVSVSDRGSGVAAGEQARIFDAFYRPADATPDAGHAGLGLSIARGLAELQGGTVHYEAREGGGSRFVLRLPAAELDPLTPADR